MPSPRSSSPSPRRSSRAAPAEPLFELRPSPIQGMGAFALRHIRKGTRLIEYTGKRISQDEANQRYDDESMERHHTFLFSLEDDVVIDGGDGGNESRFFNHSCEPNCKAYIVGDRIFLYAERHIWPGEELVYDYSFARTPDMTEEDERRYACRCGSPFCRGTILVSTGEERPAARTGRRENTSRRSARTGRRSSGRTRGAR